MGAAAGGAVGAAEDAYWREHHGTQPYAITSRPYADFAAAYRAGYAGYREGRTFEEREADLRMEYERGGGLDPGFMAGGVVHPAYPMRWEEVRNAAQAAYERVAHGKARHPEPKAEPARGAGE
jgi:hypothetical protein